MLFEHRCSVSSQAMVTFCKAGRFILLQTAWILHQDLLLKNVSFCLFLGTISFCYSLLTFCRWCWKVVDLNAVVPAMFRMDIGLIWVKVFTVRSRVDFRLEIFSHRRWAHSLRLVINTHFFVSFVEEWLHFSVREW